MSMARTLVNLFRNKSLNYATLIVLSCVSIEVYSQAYVKNSTWRCEPYSGKICAQFLSNRPIFVADVDQSTLERRVQDAYTVTSSSNDVTDRCSKFVMPAICFNTFSPCNSDGTPKYLCRDECDILEMDVCRQENIIAKTHPLLGKQDVLPICAELPPIDSEEGKVCIRLGVPEFKDVKGDSCYYENGKDYRGTVSVTLSGAKCLPWSAGHLFKWTDYPELYGGHNYCRNPGGTEERPWCFTINGTSTTEKCDVDECTDLLWFWLYILIPVIGAVLVFGIILIVCCIVYRVNSKEIKKIQEENEKRDTNPPADKPNPLSALEVPIGYVRFREELGEGAFGKVFKGEVTGMLTTHTVTPVAIKTLKADASHHKGLEFRREMELMACLQHPNIVCLLGVCIRERPMCMLFEFMPYGDLHEYLILHCIGVSAEANGDEDDYPSLRLPDLLYVAAQVATGMEYLSAHHYVHRDLAARNCLVGDHKTIKISDFGLSRDVYSSDYYRVQSNSLLPVRWMPPESILYGKFTTESDAWSFGVLLWEIFSYGLQPYYGRSNQQVVDMIRSRILLPCPEKCPPQIYGLMLHTWHALPSQRPTFRTLRADLRSLLKICSDDRSEMTSFSSYRSLHRSTTWDRSSNTDDRPTELYTPWKRQLLPEDADPRHGGRSTSPTNPHFVDERFEPRISVV